MRSALETLKPRVRRCGQEVEGLSSENTPMEQVDDDDGCHFDFGDDDFNDGYCSTSC